MSGDRRRFILAFFAYLIITFVVATAWHLVVFKDLYMTAGMRREPLLHLGILSMLIQAFLMASLYRGFVEPAPRRLKDSNLGCWWVSSWEATGCSAGPESSTTGRFGRFVGTEE